ncbi:type VII secretion integral membrane protein EccD [Salinibacterium sp. PAMC 21357]|uniref:type VII secretion integral membrane protein EccD n=1 Tax=Salinibacterium sp. PAMC 21357 TaxID=1112215 RepID=UPI000287CB5A|nr:type VII secretion integral membrane protein EccD [Salinibacterium sp. PAMC 21357]
MSQAIVSGGTLVRISIVSEGRRLDVGVPAQVPLIELLPGFARSLGVLDPTLTHGGYALHRADATVLDPALALGSQGVRDGELVTLVRGGLITEPRIYDDIVEAVIDATTSQHGEWTQRDGARTALAVSLSFLALCAVLLVTAGTGFAIGAIVAASGAVVLIATAAVLTRTGQPEAGHALGLAAALFGAIGGYLAVPLEPIWGWPLAAAGLGAVVVGGLALAFTQHGPEVHLIPIVFGLVFSTTSMIAALLPAGDPAPYAIMIAVIAALSNGLPWVALSSTRIRVISPQTDLEVFAPPQPIDANDVASRAAAGQRVLMSLRIALGLATLLATPLVAASGVAGALLCAFAFAGMMFQSRQTFARLGVLVVMLLGAAGLTLTGLTVSTALPELRSLLLILLLAATAVLVGLTLLNPKARMRLARLADSVELLILAILLPLGAIAAGIV